LERNHPVFAILVTERFEDPIVSLPPDAFRKREPVHLRSAITGKIGPPVTIRQPQAIEVSESSPARKLRDRKPSLFNAFEIFDHTGTAAKQC